MYYQRMKIEQISSGDCRNRKVESKRTNVYLTVPFDEEIKKFKKELFQFCGKRVTTAYLFREGASMLMRDLRLQIKRAKRGELHAKKRKTLV